MLLHNVYIPYGGYWSTPFCKWQGSFATMHALHFAAEVTRRALAERGIAPSVFDALHLGTTVPQTHSFYGAPWVAGMIGAEGITGPTINQACATSARVLAGAALEVETGLSRTVLTLTADRTSNGPHLLYPNPLGPGGRGESEDWVWDNFHCDPFAQNSMIQTAENVAREGQFTTQDQHDVVLLRYEQYQRALADDAAFHQRYMLTPVEVKPDGRRVVATVRDDEGIPETTAAGLAGLRPVLQDGSVTFGGQTHPADGNCGLIVTTHDQARTLSRDMAITVQVLAFGQARVRPGYMAQATVPAARQALQHAEVKLAEVRVIKTHNPFAVNDLYFAREMDVRLDAMNNYGSSLIFGHPQGPTGARLIMEMIEELVLLGGGYGLFTGCAAGDTAAAVVVKVEA
jgi:acetyl-CoA acetyltransferase